MAQRRVALVFEIPRSFIDRIPKLDDIIRDIAYGSFSVVRHVEEWSDNLAIIAELVPPKNRPYAQQYTDHIIDSDSEQVYCGGCCLRNRL